MVTRDNDLSFKHKIKMMVLGVMNDLAQGRMYRLGQERIQALKARINIAQGEALGNIKP